MYNKTQRNSKNLEYMEHPESMEGFYEIPVPENLDERIEKGIKEAKRRNRQKKIKRIAAAGMGMAAAAAVISIACVSNPTMAAKMPLIGHIFERMESRSSVKGDFSKVAEKLEETADVSENTEPAGEPVSEVSADMALENGEYKRTSNGLTVTLSEVYYNKNAMYITMTIHSEEPFPEDVKWLKNCEDYILDYESVFVEGTQNFSYMDSDDFMAGYLEGMYVDDNTIAGIFRLDLGFQTWWPTEEDLAEKGISEEDIRDEEGFISDEKVKEYFPNAGNQIEVPDAFEYDMHIERIRFPKIEGTNLLFEGNWDFHLNVELDKEDTQTVEVNEVNEQGIGLEKVVKTRYEMTVYMKEPNENPNELYVAEVFDANGEKMDYAGNHMDSRQTYGYDTSKVNIYICDYDEYMDELKGYYWSEDYEEKKKTKTYEQYIAEHALYHKEVVFE